MDRHSCRGVNTASHTATMSTCIILQAKYNPVGKKGYNKANNRQ
jgi:hypothetical protein